MCVCLCVFVCLCVCVCVCVCVCGCHCKILDSPLATFFPFQCRRNRPKVRKPVISLMWFLLFQTSYVFFFCMFPCRCPTIGSFSSPHFVLFVCLSIISFFASSTTTICYRSSSFLILFLLLTPLPHHSHYPVFHQMEGVKLFSIRQINKATESAVFTRGERTERQQDIHTAETAKVLGDDLKMNLTGEWDCCLCSDDG